MTVSPEAAFYVTARVTRNVLPTEGGAGTGSRTPDSLRWLAQGNAKMALGTRTVEINEHVFELIRLAAALDRIDVTSYIEDIVMRDIETHSASGETRGRVDFAGRYAGLAPKPWIEMDELGATPEASRKPAAVPLEVAFAPILSDVCDRCGRPLGVKMIESLGGEERHTFECISCDREQVRTVLVAA
jgi:hypothetical protein